MQSSGTNFRQDSTNMNSFPHPEDNESNEDVYNQWHVEITMGIDEIRAMYGIFDYAYETWPGAPKRPYEEQEYLRYMKNRLFAMILEYNMDN